MKFSLSWLKAHLETDATIEQVAEIGRASCRERVCMLV